MQPTTEQQQQIPSGAKECPLCHTQLPVYEGYTTWCDQCGWNVREYEPDPPSNLFESFYLSLGKRFSQNLLNEVMHATTLSPRLTISKVLAYVLAAIVHSSTLVVAGVGLLLLYSGMPNPNSNGWVNPFAIAAALLCFVIAWYLRPRMPRLPKESSVALRESFPALYQVTDQVADALNTAKIDMIIIDSDFNAGFTQIGWQRKNVLYLGLPLFSILDPQEKIALLGHELAHGVNGDASRGIFIGTAIESLVRWHQIVYPRRIRDTDEPGIGLVVMLTNFVMLSLSLLPKLGIYLLIHLLWRDSQRAEYLADYLAATVSGTQAQLSTLHKLHFRETFHHIVRVVLLHEQFEQNIVTKFRQRIGQVPARELERIKRVGQLEGSRLDTTHPDTMHRITFLSAHPIVEQKVVLSAADHDRIEQELQPAYTIVQETFIKNYYRAKYPDLVE